MYNIECILSNLFLLTLKLDSSIPFLIGNSGKNGASHKLTGQTVLELR